MHEDANCRARLRLHRVACVLCLVLTTLRTIARLFHMALAKAESLVGENLVFHDGVLDGEGPFHPDPMADV